MWTALVLATLFIAGYTWSVAQDARGLRDAVAATQLALAREQRVSAVGALAAAAAHELGSPLATIAVVAKELAHELPPDSPHAEDAALLMSQSERCRPSLPNFRSAGRGGRLALYAAADLGPGRGGRGAHQEPGVRLIFATAGAPVEDEPQVRRSPEIMHGLNNLIQNAVQFADREVTVTTFWDPATVTVEIADDGPGFLVHLLGRLGEPYLSTRAGASNHMGLGIFIAQSLLDAAAPIRLRQSRRRRRPCCHFVEPCQSGDKDETAMPRHRAGHLRQRARTKGEEDERDRRTARTAGLGGDAAALRGLRGRAHAADRR